MHALVQGISTEYVRLGKKGAPTLLVIHGWGDSSAGWGVMADKLAANFELIIPDLPGFGATQAPEDAWDLNDYAAFLAAFMKQLKVKPDGVIAHSNGGAIAVRGLADGRFTAGKLVLINSAGLRNDYKGRTKVLRLLTKTGKYLTYPLPKPLKKRLRHRVYTTIGADMLIKEDLQETFKRIVTDDIQASAAKLALSTLLIYGEDDEITPVAYGRILHSLIDGSTLETIGGAGHFAHLDKPDTTTTLIEDFFK